MIETVHALPDSLRVPRRIPVDSEVMLREILARDSFDLAVGMQDVQRYITWVALAARSPERRPLDVLKEYGGGSFRGRFAIEYANGLAGYIGCTQGVETGRLSLSYFTFVRGKHLAERAVSAFAAQVIPGVTGFELTIADGNLASRRVAAACGFTATGEIIHDTVLNLPERIYHRPSALQYISWTSKPGSVA